MFSFWNERELSFFVWNYSKSKKLFYKLKKYKKCFKFEVLVEKLKGEYEDIFLVFEEIE